MRTGLLFNLTELHATPLGGHFGREKNKGLDPPRSLVAKYGVRDVETLVRTCSVCQRVEAEHGPSAGALPYHALPVPSRRGGTVGLAFLDIPTAAFDHDFLQV